MRQVRYHVVKVCYDSEYRLLVRRDVDIFDNPFDALHKCEEMERENIDNLDLVDFTVECTWEEQ